MKKLPTCIYVWTGETMQPTLHFARLAESSFTSGQAYRLIVTEEKQREIRRTKEQNNRMWAMLDEIAEQALHPLNGKHYSAEKWKIILLHAMGRVKVEFLPALDTETFIPYGGRTSHMTIPQMTEFIEYLLWFGAAHNVRFATDQGTAWDRNS